MSNVDAVQLLRGVETNWLVIDSSIIDEHPLCDVPAKMKRIEKNLTERMR